MRKGILEGCLCWGQSCGQLLCNKVLIGEEIRSSAETLEEKGKKEFLPPYWLTAFQLSVPLVSVQKVFRGCVS